MERRQRPLSQQYPPLEPELKEEPVVRELLVRKSTRHEPLPEKRLPGKPSPSWPETGPPHGERRVPGRMDGVKGSETNGDLPPDQLIPLEELPRSETQSPALVDDLPLLRRPKHRRHGAVYDSSVSLCAGSTLIIIGICEIVLNITAIVYHVVVGPEFALNIVFYLAPGLWCAVFFILCGVFGVLSARRVEIWLLVTHLVVSTLASVFAGILIALCGWAIWMEWATDWHDDKLYVVILCIMICGAVLAGILTITAGAICCRYLCRRPADKIRFITHERY